MTTSRHTCHLTGGTDPPDCCDSCRADALDWLRSSARTHAAAQRARTEAVRDRDKAVVNAARVGLGPSEIARTLGLKSHQNVYRAIERHNGGDVYSANRRCRGEGETTPRILPGALSPGRNRKKRKEERP